jgi:hypothetical protein
MRIKAASLIGVDELWGRVAFHRFRFVLESESLDPANQPHISDHL